MPEEKGTGKHPHKDSEEPYPHHEGKTTGESSSSDNREGERRESSGSDRDESRDLKEREYRDSEGNIHHHTHTSKEMKGDKAA